MKKNNTSVAAIPELTIGLDLSDRSFQFCELNQRGEILAEGQGKLDRTGVRRYLAGKPAARVALETGGHTAWVKQIIEGGSISFGGEGTLICRRSELRDLVFHWTDLARERSKA